MMNTNISIIRLIQTSDLDVNYEISNIRAGGNINIYIRKYLNKTDHYKVIQNHIIETKTKLTIESDVSNNEYLEKKLRNLKKVKEYFIINTLYLAEALSKINPRTDRLRKAINYFEIGEIMNADDILNEAELINDQHNLIALVEYKENKIKTLENELKYLFN